MRKVLLVSVLLLLCLTTTKAQDFFTVKISGVSSIIDSMIDERSYSYEFNYGRSYGEVEADETGSVTLTLPNHEYEYIAMMPGMKVSTAPFMLTIETYISMFSSSLLRNLMVERYPVQER